MENSKWRSLDRCSTIFAFVGPFGWWKNETESVITNAYRIERAVSLIYDFIWMIVVVASTKAWRNAHVLTIWINLVCFCVSWVCVCVSECWYSSSFIVVVVFYIYIWLNQWHIYWPLFKLKVKLESLLTYCFVHYYVVCVFISEQLEITARTERKVWTSRHTTTRARIKQKPHKFSFQFYHHHSCNMILLLLPLCYEYECLRARSFSFRCANWCVTGAFW